MFLHGSHTDSRINYPIPDTTNGTAILAYIDPPDHPQIVAVPSVVLGYAFSSGYGLANSVWASVTCHVMRFVGKDLPVQVLKEQLY